MEISQSREDALPVLMAAEADFDIQLLFLAVCVPSVITHFMSVLYYCAESLLGDPPVSPVCATSACPCPGRRRTARVRTNGFVSIDAIVLASLSDPCQPERFMPEPGPGDAWLQNSSRSITRNVSWNQRWGLLPEPQCSICLPAAKARRPKIGDCMADCHPATLVRTSSQQLAGTKGPPSQQGLTRDPQDSAPLCPVLLVFTCATPEERTNTSYYTKSQRR
ncbi:hypothetical protein V8C26DRAFT_400437 [Trichoderma gracile]